MAVSERSAAGAGAETRARILAVALKLFAEQGYAGTSIRDIAQALGVTKAALYYHFDSKEEILHALTEPVITELRGLAERASADPAPAPERLLEAMVDILSRRAFLIRTVLGDPSVPRQTYRSDVPHRLAEALAGGPGRPGILRARAAVGAAQFACFSTVMARDASDFGPGASGGQRSHESLADGGDHLLAPGERREIVRSALRALGAA